MKKIFSVIALVFMFSGCATFNKIVTNDALIMQLAVQDATAHVITKHPEWKQQITNISQSGMDAIDSKTVITLSAVESYVNGKINTASMTPEDQALVSVLLTTVEGNLSDSFNAHGVTNPASQLVEVRQVLEWINNQAKL